MKWRSNRHFNGLIITVIPGAPPPNHSSSECMCDNVHRKCLCTNVIPDLDSEESPSAPVLSEPTILYAAPPSTLAPNNTAAPRRPSPRYGFPIVQSVSRHISTSPRTVFPSLTPPSWLKMCWVPFPAQRRRALWEEALPEFLPHRRHLHLLCLKLAHAASCDIYHHVIVFFLHTDLCLAERCSAWMFLAPVVCSQKEKESAP